MPFKNTSKITKKSSARGKAKKLSTRGQVVAAREEPEEVIRLPKADHLRQLVADEEQNRKALEKVKRDIEEAAKYVQQREQDYLDINNEAKMATDYDWIYRVEIAALREKLKNEIIAHGKALSGMEEIIASLPEDDISEDDAPAPAIAPVASPRETPETEESEGEGDKEPAALFTLVLRPKEQK